MRVVGQRDPGKNHLKNERLHIRVQPDSGLALHYKSIQIS